MKHLEGKSPPEIPSPGVGIFGSQIPHSLTGKSATHV